MPTRGLRAMAGFDVLLRPEPGLGRRRPAARRCPAGPGWPLSMTLAAPLLALDGVDTFYGPVQVHFGLTLEVRTGQIVCLLGGNASGKSTTMKIILGLLRPRAGRVLLDGADITGLPTPQVIRRGVGSVPEARRLFPAMTVRENLLMGAFARRDRAAVAEDLERMLDAVSSGAGAADRPGRHAVGRRAADGRDGARPDGPAAAAVHG